MDYKRLGNTGLYVSELCLGAMTFGTKDKNNWGLPTALEEESVKIMNYFVEKGGNFIDTANVYGDSEEVLGRWMQTKSRKDLVIATKVRGQMGSGVNDLGLSRKHIMWSVENSLKRMQTDYIDLLQVHMWDADTPISETYSTLNDLVRSGKVRYVGVSNYCGYQLQETIDLTKQMGWEPVVCLQPQYHLLCRSVEWDLVKICNKQGLGIIPWSPLAGGWLSGKYKKDAVQPTEGTRVAWAEKVGWRPTGWSSNNNDLTWKVLDTIETISKETGKSFAQISLRWLMQKPGVTAPIIGAKTMTQLEDNMGSIGWNLTADQMKLLDEASYLEPPYPWNQQWNNSRKPAPKK